MDEKQLLDAIENLLEKKLETSTAELKSDLVNQFNAIIETKILPEIHMVAEQHGDIIQNLKKTDEIEDIKERVCNLERAVVTHTDEIAELKKAQ